ncbi:MAG TPA: hypothetical protein VM597_00445, partial [Gemmataceae bacterium]|nr:hypothetical protein [Gemmataceae bacterium]
AEQRAALQAVAPRAVVAGAPLPAPPPGGGGVAVAVAAGGVRIAGAGAVKYDYEKLTAALRPSQLVRLRQIELHLKGPAAFADRRVVRTLGLTAEQEQKVEEIIVRYEPAFSEAASAAAFGPAVDPKPIGEVVDKYVGECVKLLGRDQKAAWDWLVGARPPAGTWIRAAGPAGAVTVQGFAPGMRLPAAPVPVPVAPVQPAKP